jgi:RNA polymerase sigma-70 factor (ECF subfamily)
VSHSLSADEEQRLIEQARSDPEAFRALYRAYFAKVYGYVAYRVGRKQDAEDLVADIFVKVLEHLDRFEYRGDGSFAAWVFRIASNHVNAFYRRSGRRGEPIPLADLPEIQGTSPRPDEVLLKKEQFDILRRMIGTLPPRRQEVITLRFFGGLRNQEIAVLLDLDERTIASHLARALTDLNRRYRALLIEPEKERVDEPHRSPER